jgi:hypothetical protein
MLQWPFLIHILHDSIFLQNQKTWLASFSCYMYRTYVRTIRILLKYCIVYEAFTVSKNVIGDQVDVFSCLAFGIVFNNSFAGFGVSAFSQLKNTALCR